MEPVLIACVSLLCVLATSDTYRWCRLPYNLSRYESFHKNNAKSTDI